jgi:uncharacterized membrane protein YbaN (DUF454 family)
MKHFVLNLLLLIALVVVGISLPPYKTTIFVLLLACLFLNRYFETAAILNRHFTGELQFRRQKKSISGVDILFISFWSLFFLLGDKDVIYTLIVLLALLLTSLVDSFLYKKTRPVTLSIQGTELTFSDSWVMKRNLETLTHVHLNSVTNNLTCRFADKAGMVIKYSDYKEQEMALFVETIKRKSKQLVDVSPNLLMENR